MSNTIVIGSAELAAALKASLLVTKTVASTPSLKGVHLSTSTENLLLTATDRYILMRTAVPDTSGDALTPGDIGTVAEDDVKNLLKVLPTRPTAVALSVEEEEEEENTLSVHIVGGARLEIRLSPSHQFPTQAVHLFRHDSITNAPHFAKDAAVREGTSPVIELDASKGATVYKMFELLGWQSVRSAFQRTRNSGGGVTTYFVGGRENLTKAKRSTGFPLPAMVAVMGMNPKKDSQDDDPEMPYAELDI